MICKTISRRFPASLASVPFLACVQGDKLLISLNANSGIREEDAQRYVFACVALGYICSEDEAEHIPIDEAREKAISALMAQKTAADLKAMMRKERRFSHD